MLERNSSRFGPTQDNRSAGSKPSVISGRLIVVLGLAALTALAGVAGFYTGRGQVAVITSSLPGTPRAQAQRFLPFWEAWWQIEHQFYSPKPLDATAMTYGAISGLLDSLRDPFAGFRNPPEHRMENDTFAGEFGGIGAWLAKDEQGAYIDSILPHSSAERSGLQGGDRLRMVAETPVGMAELQTAALLIRGPVPTLVHLVVERSGVRLSFELPRLVVELPSVEWQLISEGVGYVRIAEFTGRTASEFASAMVELRARGIRVLLLDLRDNGGGLPAAATGVLSQLVTGSIAYREQRPNGEETRIAIPFAAVPAESMPLAVLVDGGTASAAEIVAAAIQDYQRGPLIGASTYGKGSVQGVYTLKDGSSIRITTARWLTPLGKPIDAVGLQPDMLAQNSEEAQSLAAEYFARHAGIVAGSLYLPPPPDNTGKVLV